MKTNLLDNSLIQQMSTINGTSHYIFTDLSKIFHSFLDIPFDDNYDVEEFLKKSNIDHSLIEFDSESCCFEVHSLSGPNPLYKFIKEVNSLLTNTNTNLNTNTSPIPSNIVFYAFRYALGRQTYAPTDVIDFIQSNPAILSKHDFKQMISEISQASSLGSSSIDKPKWLEFSNWLQQQL